MSETPEHPELKDLRGIAPDSPDPQTEVLRELIDASPVLLRLSEVPLLGRLVVMTAEDIQFSFRKVPSIFAKDAAQWQWLTPTMTCDITPPTCMYGGNLQEEDCDLRRFVSMTFFSDYVLTRGGDNTPVSLVNVYGGAAPLDANLLPAATTEFYKKLGYIVERDGQRLWRLPDPESLVVSPPVHAVTVHGA